ncbi:MAG: transporter [Acidobacteria bacterium]|nr:MAG: transporter [Acidobacteriota bacterium]
MSNYDYAVVAIYLCFISSIGLIFRKFNKDSSDFFRGGGNILWWLVGATAFMSQFSAWTFTGAASKAYTDGTLVMVIFVGNGIGYFMAYLWAAARFRQMRVVTPMEGIRERFGRANEQFFTWIWIPIGVFYAGIWLNAVSKFVSVVFGMEMTLTVVVVGLVVLFVASLGGSWAIAASDFMQMLILMSISIVIAFLAIGAVGDGSFLTGLTRFTDRLPANHLDWTAILRPEIVYLWVFAAVVKQFCTICNMNDSHRFLYAKDSRNARKAALLSAILFFVGPIIWFVPPMAAAILYPDLSVIPELSRLGARVTDGAYVAIALRTMPVGMIGLMVTAIFAATMSSMDTGLNKTAGIFLRNFYKPILRKQASEREYLVVGRVVSIFFGILVILCALIIETIPDFGLFDVMMLFSSMVAIPFVIPLIWAIIIKRSPSWSGWSTVIVGLLVSVFSSSYLNPETVRKLIGLDSPFAPQERDEYLFFTSLILNVVVASLWFLGTCLFARKDGELAREQSAFWDRTRQPVIADPEASRAMDRAQLTTLSRMCIPYGSFVMLLCVVPNPLAGRLCFVFAGGMIVVIGLILRHAAKKIVIPLAEAVTGRVKETVSTN